MANAISYNPEQMMNTTAAANSPYAVGGVSGRNDLNPMTQNYSPPSAAAPQNTSLVPTAPMTSPVAGQQWQSWLNSGPTPDQARGYARQYGYTPDDMSDFYNKQGLGAPLNPVQAAGNMGLPNVPITDPAAAGQWRSWLTDTTSTPEQTAREARWYANQFGYGAQDMADFYNTLGLGDPLTAQQAAANMGLPYLPMDDPGAASQWQEWLPSGATPTEARNYAQSYGYSPQQMADFYNTLGLGRITPEQAAANMGLSGYGNNPVYPIPTVGMDSPEAADQWFDWHNVGGATPENAVTYGIEHGYSPQDLADYYNYLGLGNQITEADARQNMGLPQTAGVDFSGISPSFSYSTDTGGSVGLNQSNSFAGLSEPARGQAIDLVSNLGDGNIADLIDQWTTRALNQFQFTGDDAARIMNQAANVGAARGIMGGTQQDYLRGNLFGQALQDLQNRRGQVLTQAIPLKSEGIQNILSLLRDSTSTGTGLNLNNNHRFSYSQSPDDYRIILDLIRAGYTG